MIVKAAILVGNEIFAGRTHNQAFDIAKNACWNHPDYDDFMVKLRSEKTEGFLTDQGIFLDRTKAAEHAFNCGQISERVHELQSWMISE